MYRGMENEGMMHGGMSVRIWGNERMGMRV